MTTTRFVAIATTLTVVGVCILKAQVQQNSKDSGPGKVGVNCSISAKTSSLEPGARNDLKVTILNRSTSGITITSLTVYLSPAGYPKPSAGKLDERAFSAPVNLKTKGALEAKQGKNDTWHYPSTSLEVSAGLEKTFTLDLSSLLWGRLNAGQLPSQRLRSVEPGNYELFVSGMTTGDNEFGSNRVPVTLVRR